MEFEYQIMSFIVRRSRRGLLKTRGTTNKKCKKTQTNNEDRAAAKQVRILYIKGMGLKTPYRNIKYFRYMYRII